MSVNGRSGKAECRGPIASVQPGHLVRGSSVPSSALTQGSQRSEAFSHILSEHWNDWLRTECTREKVSIHVLMEGCFHGKAPTHHLRVQSHLGEAFAFAPEQRVGLVAEESFSHASRRNAQQVAVPEGLHTLLLRAVDHAEHLQQQLETCRVRTAGRREGRRRDEAEQPGRESSEGSFQ